MKLILLTLILVSQIAFIMNLQATPVWLKGIKESQYPEQYRSIEAIAKVRVSDGKHYTTHASWQGPDYALFNLTYPDRQVTVAKEGLYYWRSDGKQQTDSDTSIRAFILGHQLHAQLMFPQYFMTRISDQKLPSSRCSCDRYEANDLDDNPVEFHVDKTTSKLSYAIIHNKQHGTMSQQYLDWREVEDMVLPHQILIVHEGRTFDYQFQSIRFNQRTLYQRYRTDYELLTDEQKIRRLHQDMIDAHIASDATLMSHIWADDITMVNRGKISNISGKDAADFMSRSLAGRVHSRYVDLELPSVVLSADKTLGYLTARVQAEGHPLDQNGITGEAFQFTSAWMATFRKIDGHWKMTANASNFEP